MVDSNSESENICLTRFQWNRSQRPALFLFGSTITISLTAWPSAESPKEWPRQPQSSASLRSWDTSDQSRVPPLTAPDGSPKKAHCCFDPFALEYRGIPWKIVRAWRSARACLWNVWTDQIASSPRGVTIHAGQASGSVDSVIPGYRAEIRKDVIGDGNRPRRSWMPMHSSPTLTDTGVSFWKGLALQNGLKLAWRNSIKSAVRLRCHLAPTITKTEPESQAPSSTLFESSKKYQQ
jgi:hypothetical protein